VSPSGGAIPLPRAVLFDLDGTLSDSLPDIHAALDTARRELGLPGVTPEQVRGWVGCGAAMLVAHSLGHDDETAPDVRRVLPRFLAIYESHADERSTLYPGVGEALDLLRAHGVRLAVTTNKPARAADALLAGLGVLERFEVVVTPDLAGTRKPDAAFIRFALERLGVAAGDALVVGDGLPDLHAARGAGVACVALLGGYGDKAALLADGPEFVAEDVAEVVRRMGLGGRDEGDQ
jgi:phosphoglycolate phosphatase